MKRHPAFQDLSRDHFTALNQVVQVRRVVEADRFAGSEAQALDDLRALVPGLEDHFDEEDRLLLPILDGRPEGKQHADRLREDHAWLRDAMAALDDADLEAAWAFCQRLKEHARWEEDVMFEDLQRWLTDPELAALEAAGTVFRREHGMPLGPGRPS